MLSELLHVLMYLQCYAAVCTTGVWDRGYPGKSKANIHTCLADCTVGQEGGYQVTVEASPLRHRPVEACMHHLRSAGVDSVGFFVCV